MKLISGAAVVLAIGLSPLAFAATAGQHATPAEPRYTLIDLSAAPYGFAEVTAISDSGRIAGMVLSPDGALRAARHVRGTTTTLSIPDDLTSTAQAINARGDVVGAAQITANTDSAAGIRRAFLARGDAATPLPALGGSGAESLASALNGAGVVVGSSQLTAGGASRATRWTDGVAEDLGVLPGCVESRATAINDRGQLAGTCVAGDGTAQAFRLEAGSLRALGSLGGASSRASGMNGSGWVVGTAENASGNPRAFRWRDGRMTNLGVLDDGIPGGGSAALAINDSGVIIGAADVVESGAGNTRAVAWYGGARPVDLNSRVVNGAGWTLRSAVGLNEAGAIVGTADFGAESRPYLLQPLRPPEVRILGSKVRRLRGSVVTLRGRVEGRFDRLRFALARGSTITGRKPIEPRRNWSRTFVVKRGRTQVLVWASGPNGISASREITVVRR